MQLMKCNLCQLTNQNNNQGNKYVRLHENKNNYKNTIFILISLISHMVAKINVLKLP